MNKLWPRNRKVQAGLWILIVFVVFAVLGPVLAVNIMGVTGKEIGVEGMQPPNGTHILGTTIFGEDVFAQLAIGARTSLLTGLIAGLISTGLSVFIGVGGAYAGGKLDGLLNLFTNVFLVIPGLPLLIIIASYLKGQGGWVLVALIIGLTGWAGGARQKRSQTLSIRQRDYVTSAELLGESKWRVAVFEVMPNLAPLISSTFVFAVVGAVFADAALAFIGVGNINTISWGTMMYYASQQNALILGGWWWFLPPGLCIALLGTAAGLINFGVDELSNRRLSAPRPAKGRTALKTAGTIARGVLRA